MKEKLYLTMLRKLGAAGARDDLYCGFAMKEVRRADHIRRLLQERAVILVPDGLGRELITRTDKGTLVRAGTGFNLNNGQHTHGSCALRYAISIQQSRDTGDYTLADAKWCKAKILMPHVEIGTSKEGCVVNGAIHWRDGIMYDGRDREDRA